jgi:glucosamine-6-phosphate deaminase
VTDSIIEKMEKGMRKEENEVFLHTGPHHDDIMLGILPYIANHIRVHSNEFHFAVLTSGFTAVTNQFVTDLLVETKKFLDEGLIQMVNYPDFYTIGFKLKSDKDVYHYLNKVAAGEHYERRRGVCHRVVRALVQIFSIKSTDQLRDVINEVLTILRKSYDGEKNPPKIQQLKGMIREFEEELVWAHYGLQVKNVRHLRLGFYQGDIFTEQPEQERDVLPILDMLRELNPPCSA